MIARVVQLLIVRLNSITKLKTLQQRSQLNCGYQHRQLSGVPRLEPLQRTCSLGAPWVPRPVVPTSQSVMTGAGACDADRQSAHGGLPWL